MPIGVFDALTSGTESAGVSSQWDKETYWVLVGCYHNKLSPNLSIDKGLKKQVFSKFL